MVSEPDTFTGVSERNAAAHTKGLLDCPACAGRAAELKLSVDELPQMGLREAASLWREMRAGRNLKARTREFDAFALGSLERFFGDLPLGAVTAGHLREYQLARAQNAMATENGVTAPWTRAAGPSTINHELGVLRQLLRLARLWHRIAPWYGPLPVPSWSPREIPDIDQEQRIFEAARGDPRCQFALWVATITANTSASGSELRHIRLRHLFLRAPVDGLRSEVYIPLEGCKNGERPRKIPLNAEARWAFGQCYERALRLGAAQPDHYLFPFRVRRNTFDPARPASRSWIKKDWERLRAVTGCPKLCAHDFRHLFVTRLLEAGERPEVVQALSGHVSRKMMDYYSHFDLRTKAAAVDLLDRRGAVPKKPEGRVMAWIDSRPAVQDDVRRRG